ncbi:ABC transporter permease [Desulfovibrio sp. OttesenSCG-928-I05]|nr:ABC transporter permease [Desulfovibrio sp. OttesenSCG-928-I05]
MKKIASAFTVLKRHPNALIGSIMVTLLILMALCAPLLAPHDPLKINPKNRFDSPSITHIMGTDEYGRDILSRIIYGSRTALTVGLSATTLSAIFGSLIGLSCAYAGGKVDEIVMRFMDILMSFPGILFALILLAGLGSNIGTVIIAIATPAIPKTARIARSAGLAVRREEYIEAAIVRGDNPLYILLVEMLPNTIQPVIVDASIKVGFAILTAASISFLGMGVQPPTPDWGLIVGQAREYIFESPMLIVWPIAAIAVTTISFNLLGDGLRDILDPRELGRI